MLNDISGLLSWGKLRKGLGKLWVGEVLGKFVVIQHWRFGEVLRSFDKIECAGEEGYKWSGGKDPSDSAKAKGGGGGGGLVFITNASGKKIPINTNASNNNIGEGGGGGGSGMPATKAPWAK